MNYHKIKKLAIALKSLSAKDESKKANNIFDVMAKDKTVIDTKEELFNALKRKKFKIFIDSPKGSKKGFGSKKRVLPFDYGEISELINPSDDMGWDVIIPPSQSSDDFEKIYPIGVIEINPDKEIWREKADKAPPVGNDKIIISKDGKISEEDKEIIESFFYKMWQFKDIDWL